MLTRSELYDLISKADMLTHSRWHGVTHAHIGMVSIEVYTLPVPIDFVDFVMCSCRIMP